MTWGPVTVGELSGPPVSNEVWQVLCVAFGERDRAAAIWAELGPVLEIDTIAHDAHGVFGQLADGLRDIDPTSDLLPRLDGVRKRLWTKNALRVRAVLQARDELLDAGLQAEPGGGLAVLLRATDLGQRPLVDAELVVEAADAEASQAVLQGRGWRPVVRRRDGWLLDLHAVTLRQGGHELTLRWCDSGWPYGPPVEPGDRVAPGSGAEVSLPTTADLLAYTLIEGYRLWGYTPTRRYADALMLLREPDAPSWGRLREAARLRSGSLPVEQALTALRAVTHRVPDDILADLRQDSGGRRATWALAAGPRYGTAAVLLRRTNGLPVVRALGSAPSVLRDVWDVPRSASLVGVAASRARTRLGTRRSSGKA